MSFKRLSVPIFAVLLLAGCSGSGGNGGGAPSVVAPTPGPLPSANVAPDSIIVPLSQIGGNGVSPVVMVSVGGGKQFPVLLDTGSAGLRVFTDALGPNVTQGGTPVNQFFGSGVEYIGTAATAADVTIGSIDVGHSVVIQAISQICPLTNNMTDCTKNNIPAVEAGGKYGILGVRADITQNGIFSPMSELPGNLGSGFIVSLNNGSNEQLIVGLTPQNTAGFDDYTNITVQKQSDGIGVGWNKVAFPWCVSSPGLLSSTCVQNGLLPDTGTATLSMALPTTMPVPGLTTAAGRIEPGVALNFTLGPISWGFMSGSCQSYNTGTITAVAPGNGGGGFGVVAYYHNDVMYDLKSGRFGFRPTTTGVPTFCHP